MTWSANKEEYITSLADHWYILNIAGCHGDIVTFSMHAVLTRAFNFLCSVSRRQSVRRMACSFFTVWPRLPVGVSETVSKELVLVRCHEVC